MMYTTFRNEDRLMSRFSALARIAVLGAVALAVIALPIHEGIAGNPNYNLRTEPPSPVAGQPFFVVADSGLCYTLFVGNPTGTFEYGGVTMAPGVIRAQVGYQEVFSCNGNLSSVRQRVDGVPAGTYNIELIVQEFLVPQNENLVATISVQVAVAGPGVVPQQIPVLGSWSAFALVLLLGGGAGLCLLSIRQR